jgi:hypothetical protein
LVIPRSGFSVAVALSARHGECRLDHRHIGFPRGVAVMIGAAVWAAVLLAPAAGGTSPDPKALAIPPAEVARARELIGKLGDDVYHVREQATRDLYKMGRLALPAVERALSTATDPEVKARCEWLLPKAVAADHKARLDTFLADADGKFEHDLAGWNELAKVTGNSKPARELFVEMIKNKTNAELLAAARTPEVLGPKIVARRMELYNRVFRFTPDGKREPPTVPEMAATLLVETLAAATTDRRYYFAPYYVLQQPGMREAVQGEKADAFRKLVVHWLNSRTDPQELSQAMNLVATLNLKEANATTFAAKVIETAGALPYNKMQAATVLAKSGDKAHLPRLRKLFGDATAQTVFRGGAANRIEVKTCDVALAMSLVLTGQNPKDYGFDVQSPNEAARYTWTNFTLPSDERRQAAFIRWVFWEVKQKK